MKTIPLTQRLFTKVDDDDYKKFAIYRWYAGLSGGNKRRAVRSITINKKKIKISLSREIMEAPKGLYVDHINGDTLDNRKANLRICTIEENNHNRKIGRDNTSGYKGVYFHIRDKKWRAQIRIKNKKYTIGSYNTKEEAALAYNKSALENYGQFAKINNL